MGSTSFLPDKKLDRRVRNYYDHRNCPQANYARVQLQHKSAQFDRFYLQSQGRNLKNHGTYSDAVINGPTYRTFRGQNIYNHLN